MSELSAEQVADAMHALVKEYHGKRQLKPIDLDEVHDRAVRRAVQQGPMQRSHTPYH